MHQQSSLWPAHGAEEWRPIPGYDGYEASSEGRIRSLRYRRRAGVVIVPRRKRPTRQPLVLKLIDNGNGYLHCFLAEKSVLVHRVILSTFAGPCPLGWQGSHLNGVRTDNRLANLRWETVEENLAHREEHGTLRRRAARLTEVQALAIRSDLAHGVSKRRVAAAHGVSDATVLNIAHGRTWRHLE